MVRAILAFCLTLVLLTIGSSIGQAQTSGTSDIHLGVTTCAGSTCHGQASTSKKTGVLQNEYLTWQRKDKHARAYKVLTEDLGKRIGANLGMDQPEKEKICLDCHADNVPASARGVQFQIADGVGCEACHGGSQTWMGSHISGRVTHDQLVSDEGLYPTERPEARAKLCLSCHLGDADRMVTHRIMGAGHPRLSFELQTYTQLEPAHFVIDDVYRKRKTVYQGVQFWAAGQATALGQLAENIASGKNKGTGLFPELSFFDCHACHHSMTNLRYQKKAGTDFGPGVPHFNDSNAIMVRALAGQIAPDLGAAIESNIRALHLAYSAGQGNPSEIAKTLGEQAHELSAQLKKHTFSKTEMKDLVLALSKTSDLVEIGDYGMAEQVVMAYASIIYTLHTEGALTDGQYATVKTGLELCYGATQKEDSYDPSKFSAASHKVAEAASTW